MRRLSLLVLSLCFLGAVTAEARGTMAKVKKVIDGSTIVVASNGTDSTIRLVSIAVPPADEKRPLLKQLNEESRAFLETYLKDAWVYLEYPGGKAVADAQGVTPAFVYRGSDGRFVNERLISEGFAIANRKEKSEFTPKFMEKEAEAKAAQRGLWGSFEGGHGSDIASGKVSQGAYVGVPGEGGRQSSEVTYWVMIFY